MPLLLSLEPLLSSTPHLPPPPLVASSFTSSPLAHTTSHSIQTWAHLHTVLLPILLTFTLQKRSSIVIVYLLPNLLLTLLIPTQPHFLHYFPIVFLPLAIISDIQHTHHHQTTPTKTFSSLAMFLAFCFKINHHYPLLSAPQHQGFISLQLFVILSGLTILIFHSLRRPSLPRIHPVRALATYAMICLNIFDVTTH